MAEDPQTGLDPDEDPGEPRDPGTDPSEDQEGSEGQGKDQKTDPDPEKARLIKSRDTAKEKNRQLQDKVRELEEKLNPGKVDPIQAANRRLITAEARVVLTAKGLQDTADQRAVLDLLKLDDVDVSADGEVDASAIADQVDTLLGIAKKLAAAAGGNGGRGRNPRIDPRDRGGEAGKTVDAATKRRMEMLR